MRVYPADAAAPRPTPGLVWAHGGGFVAGDLDMPEADWLARTFAARGVTVVSIDYRLAGDGDGRYPAGSDDVLAAWSWTLDHAEELGLDPVARRDRRGAAPAATSWRAPCCGCSAGHRRRPRPRCPPASSSPTRPCSRCSPRRGPSCAPRSTRTPRADRFGPDARARHVRAATSAAPSTMHRSPRRRASPSRPTSSGFPPTLVVNGDVDELRVSGELFAATLAAAGVPVELAFEPGTEHGHLNRPDEPAASATDRPRRRLDRPRLRARGIRCACGIRPHDHHLNPTEGTTS